MRKVILESPYGAADQRVKLDNIDYARRCMRDCLLRAESPFAAHLLYTQTGVLDDDKPDERRAGMTAGFAWFDGVDAIVVYTDRGISPGMEKGIEVAKNLRIPVEYRRLGER